MADTYTKICPECGAENNSNDLFCRDCGASLAMVTADSQHTAAFTPIDPDDGTQTTTINSAYSPPAMDSGAYTNVPAAQPPAYSYIPETESARGAVLGWLAATLILIIVAAFIWSSVISDATRDSITGIF